MTPRRTRQDGWRWPAVLAVSAVLVATSAARLASAPPEVAANVPLDAQVAVPATPTSSPRATSAPGWRARSAAPRASRTEVPPERLVARSVGLDLPVTPMGVRGDGQMALPDQPSRLGWYEFGAAPADRQGAVVLAGHVDSARYGSGPLVRAASLERGDDLQVRDSAGRTTTYEVVRVQRIAKSRFSGADVFDREGPAVLRLITCGGVYDPARGGYQDNLVVTAERR